MTKKILLGICGIGNGHINRQRQIIDKLLSYDVDLVLAVPSNAYERMTIHYPTLKILPVYVPWVYCNNDGIDFQRTINSYVSDKKDLFESFLKFAILVQEAFDGFNPDFVMTDYEPNVAQFAYATNIPLICLDQHSKFLAMPHDIINGCAIKIETSRLNFFFPKADTRYVSTFFEISPSRADYNIVVLPPIVKNLKRQETYCERKVLVYFSTYTQNPFFYTKVMEMIKKYPTFNFVIYTDLEFDNYRNSSNITFKPISDDFNNDLLDCSFIISPGGHQLISEAIYLGIPMMVFPLNTYDQNCCCRAVTDNNLGKMLSDFSIEEFDSFLEEIERFRENIKTYRMNFWKKTWDSVLFADLECKYGIRKLTVGDENKANGE